MIVVEDVFNDWNRDLLRALRRSFRGTSLATLEDGAAFAWAQFVAKPPPDEYALAWLKLVARREVLRLIRRWEQPVEGRPEDNHGESMALQLEARELLRQVDVLRPGPRTALTCKKCRSKPGYERSPATSRWMSRSVARFGVGSLWWCGTG